MAETQPAPPMGNVSSQMLMMMMIFGTMFIMFIPSLRDGVGNIAGLVLEPIIGFNGAYPVLTVLLAGIGLVTFSSGVRHYFINWIESAEKQFKMKDFNKKLRDARMSGNDAEVKRLTQKQLQMSTEQMSTMMDQMKPMMFTMIFLIATFAFIGTFIGGIPGATLSVPWAGNVDMNAALSSSTCCAFSNWMLVYMLISMSVAQVIQRVFKLYSFNKMLKDPESLTKPSATKAEPEYEEPEDEETDEEDEYLIIDDDENTSSDLSNNIESKTDLSDSIQLNVPEYMEIESSTDIVILVENKTEGALQDLSLDFSDLQGFFKIEERVYFPVIKPNVKFNKRVRITAKPGIDGTFPINVTVTTNKEKTVKKFTIKVGGTEIY